MERVASGIEIRHLASGMLDDLVDAQNEIFQDYVIPVKSSRQFFLDFLKSVGGSLVNILVATDKEGKIRGYINPVVDGTEGWIGGIGMHPQFRGLGIGTRLMLEAEENLRAKGVKEISLEVIEGNDSAQRLYEKLGYTATRKFLTAEGKPSRFEGYDAKPSPATMTELLSLHERSYGDACWQRKKADALVQSARGAECYKIDGGFVLVRTVEATGFIPFLGVVPEERRKGLGTALAKFALTRLYDLGAFKTALYNVNEDVPTLKMLDMFDFKVTMKQIEMRKDI